MNVEWKKTQIEKEISFIYLLANDLVTGAKQMIYRCFKMCTKENNNPEKPYTDC